MILLLNILTLGIIRFVLIQEGTAKLVTRFGKYVKTLYPGMRSYFSLWGLSGKIYGFPSCPAIVRWRNWI